MNKLRHIAVTVEEPDPGQFAWVLIERAGRGWRDLQRSEASADSYSAAMSEGLLALQAIVEDLETGPRMADTHAAADRPARKRGQAKEEQDPPPKETPGGKSYFGFGPVR